MKLPHRFSVIALAVALLFVPLSPLKVAAASSPDSSDSFSAQQSSDTLQRGYRTGYSDGYQAGWGDRAAGRANDYRSKADYRSAERTYVAEYGSLEDFRDGYRQGFELGYSTGFNRGGFDSTVPENLRRRDTANNDHGSRNDDHSSRQPDDAPAANPSANPSTPVLRRSGQTSDSASRDDGNTIRRTPSGDDAARTSSDAARNSPASGDSIPADTILRVELLNRLSTDVNMRGDRFEARVVEPQQYQGALVSGRISTIRRAGKVRGAAELQLDFEQIRFVNGPWADFDAQVIEVVAAGDDQGVGEVDPEGGVRGKSTTKDDVAKVGATAGIGAIIGAIAGGGKGAAIGAAIGGSVGAGGVLTQRGREIRLERGQHLRLRATRETRL